MEWSITAVARLVMAGKRIQGKRMQFLAVFAVVFLGSIVTLANNDLLPDASKASAEPVISISASQVIVSPSTPIVVSEEPVKIVIPIIDLSATVSNPTTTDMEALDTYLLKGAVRYPTSAKLGEMGNVVLFGHSSYLPIVGNQAYKTFDGIQKLVAGDVITVYSADAVYTYKVRTVTKENVASGAGISLATTGQVLTLATCNSFATKSDRFIVTADFVESHLISS